MAVVPISCDLTIVLSSLYNEFHQSKDLFDTYKENYMTMNSVGVITNSRQALEAVEQAGKQYRRPNQYIYISNVVYLQFLIKVTLEKLFVKIWLVTYFRNIVYLKILSYPYFHMLLRSPAFATAFSDCQDRCACVNFNGIHFHVRNLDVFLNTNVKF